MLRPRVRHGPRGRREGICRAQRSGAAVGKRAAPFRPVQLGSGAGSRTRETVDLSYPTDADATLVSDRCRVRSGRAGPRHVRPDVQSRQWRSGFGSAIAWPEGLLPRSSAVERCLGLRRLSDKHRRRNVEPLACLKHFRNIFAQRLRSTIFSATHSAFPRANGHNPIVETDRKAVSRSEGDGPLTEGERDATECRYVTRAAGVQ